MVNFNDFTKAIALDPSNEWALEGYAKGLLSVSMYDKAEKLYLQLMKEHPDNLSYTLNYTLCLLNLDKLEKAKSMIFKVYYKYDTNKNVKRLFAWIMLKDDNIEKAYNVYTELLEMPSVKAEDYLNAGYSRWFKGDIDEASKLFKRWATHVNQSETSLDREFARDKDLLDKYGISDVSKILMQALVEK